VTNNCTLYPYRQILWITLISLLTGRLAVQGLDSRNASKNFSKLFFFFRILQEVFEKQYRLSGAHGHKYLVKCVLPNFTIRLWISSFFEVFPSGNSTDALQNFKIMLYTEAITQLSILKQRKVRCQ
jgi:hypothetical protein